MRDACCSTLVHVQQRFPGFVRACVFNIHRYYLFYFLAIKRVTMQDRFLECGRKIIEFHI